MTYRELIEAIKAQPDHWLDDTVRVAVPIKDTDDYEMEADVECLHRDGYRLMIRAVATHCMAD